MMEGTIAIKLQNVSKTFTLLNRGYTIRESLLSMLRGNSTKKVKALHNISLEVRKGEFIGIIGNNGSGKSTLIQIINQSIYPDKGGRVELNGKSMRLALGMGFDKELTARQNIFINGSVLGLTIKQIKEKIDGIISFAELEKFADNPVKFYSNGMKSKLMFSIAVHANADIFLFDEFFGGVGDKNFKKKADEVFHNKLIKGKTVVMVSHNHELVQKHCDRVIEVKDGEIVFDGSIQEYSF